MNFSSISPVAILATMIAAATVSAGRFWPCGPLGMVTLPSELFGQLAPGPLCRNSTKGSVTGKNIAVPKPACNRQPLKFFDQIKLRHHDGCVALLLGKLDQTDAVIEAGIIAQVKTAKAAA